jgi:hypothetical protein
MGSPEFARNSSSPESSAPLEERVAALEHSGFMVYIEEIKDEGGPPVYLASLVDKIAYRHMTGQMNSKDLDVIPDFFRNHPLARFGFSYHEALDNAEGPWTVFLD